MMTPNGNKSQGEFDPYAMVNPYDKKAKAQKRYAKQEWREQQKAGLDASAFARPAPEAFPGTPPIPPVASSPSASAIPALGEEDYETWLKRSARRRRLAIGIIAAFAVLVIAVVSSFLAYDNLRTANISSYAQSGISVSGLEDEDFIITPETLKDYEIVNLSTTGTGKGEGGESKAGTVNAYGPSMESFLATYGYTLTDFRSIRFLCKDGYTTVLRPSRMEDEVVIMSFAAGKEPLKRYQQPMRIVIPDGDTGQWCFGILRIEFVSADAESDERELSDDGDSLSSDDTSHEQRTLEDDAS
jgi:hypothetical protein